MRTFLCRLSFAVLANVCDRCRTSTNSGPAHHRISAENDYFYRHDANSRISVTPLVTPAAAAAYRTLRGVQLAHFENIFGADRPH